jgi:uncharacterized iron-regulated membrane protein
VGLGAAIVLPMLAGTGTILLFANEMDRALNPKLPTVAPQPTNLPFAEIPDRVRKQLNGRPIQSIWGLRFFPGKSANRADRNAVESLA